MATIRVLDGYQGRPSNERFIPAGVYDDNDPALHGAAAYLLANGFAETVGNFPGAIQENPPRDPLSDLTVKQLEELATTHDIDLGTATSKNDIVAAIRASGKLPDGQ